MKRNSVIVIAVLLCLCILCSCSLTENNPVRINFFSMDTVINLTVYGKNAEKAALAAKEEIIRLNDIFSPEEKGSDIYKINHSSSAEVSDECAFLISRVCEVSEHTGGALDISVYPLVKEWGFISKNYNIPDRDRITALLKNTGYEKIKVDGNTVSLPENMQITLGCAAKGYAAARAAEVMNKMGIEGAVLSLGGNVQTIGKKPDSQKWNIAIADPENTDKSIGTISVEEAAVVTSGAYQRNFTRDGVTYHHILNPKTGYPSDSGLSSVTVICSDGALADSLSTALFVLGYSKGMELYNSLGNFDAVFVTQSKKIYTTPGIASDFTLSGEGGYVYG